MAKGMVWLVVAVLVLVVVGLCYWAVTLADAALVAFDEGLENGDFE